MASLQLQLEESKHGLQAASRISDQLEQSKQLSSTLKGEGKFFVICVFFLEVNS
jgi:hypothetical protein